MWWLTVALWCFVFFSEVTVTRHTPTYKVLDSFKNITDGICEKLRQNTIPFHSIRSLSSTTYSHVAKIRKIVDLPIGGTPILYRSSIQNAGTNITTLAIRRNEEVEIFVKRLDCFRVLLHCKWNRLKNWQCRNGWFSIETIKLTSYCLQYVDDSCQTKLWCDIVHLFNWRNICPFDDCKCELLKMAYFAIDWSAPSMEWISTERNCMKRVSTIFDFDQEICRPRVDVSQSMDVIQMTPTDLNCVYLMGCCRLVRYHLFCQTDVKRGVPSKKLWNNFNSSELIDATRPHLKRW